MDLVSRFANRIVVLVEGAVLADGTPDQIRRDLHGSRALVLERGAVVHAAPAEELRSDARTLERLVGITVH